MSFLSENLTQFTVAQFAYPTLAAGCGQVQACACGLQRKKENLVAAAILLEALHHFLTLLDAAAAMQEERSLADSCSIICCSMSPISQI